MNRDTPLVKFIFKPLIFGLYFVFFFTQLNYISKYYSAQDIGFCSCKIHKEGKTAIVHGASQKNRSKEQTKLNKRYFPKNLYEAPDGQLLILPEIDVLVTERISITTPILHFSPFSTFKRGPPSIS